MYACERCKHVYISEQELSSHTSNKIKCDIKIADVEIFTGYRDGKSYIDVNTKNTISDSTLKEIIIKLDSMLDNECSIVSIDNLGRNYLSNEKYSIPDDLFIENLEYIFKKVNHPYVRAGTFICEINKLINENKTNQNIINYKSRYVKILTEFGWIEEIPSIAINKLIKTRAKQILEHKKFIDRIINQIIKDDVTEWEESKLFKNSMVSFWRNIESFFRYGITHTHINEYTDFVYEIIYKSLPIEE